MSDPVKNSGNIIREEVFEDLLSHKSRATSVIHKLDPSGAFGAQGERIPGADALVMTSKRVLVLLVRDEMPSDPGECQVLEASSFVGFPSAIYLVQGEDRYLLPFGVQGEVQWDRWKIPPGCFWDDAIPSWGQFLEKGWAFAELKADFVDLRRFCRFARGCCGWVKFGAIHDDQDEPGPSAVYLRHPQSSQEILIPVKPSVDHFEEMLHTALVVFCATEGIGLAEMLRKMHPFYDPVGDC